MVLSPAAFYISNYIRLDTDHHRPIALVLMYAQTTSDYVRRLEAAPLTEAAAYFALYSITDTIWKLWNHQNKYHSGMVFILGVSIKKEGNGKMVEKAF
jgi:hypothetical protein